MTTIGVPRVYVIDGRVERVTTLPAGDRSAFACVKYHLHAREGALAFLLNQK